MRQWLWSVLAGFLGAFIGFRYIAIPFYRNVTRHMLAQLDSDAVVEDQFNPNFVTLATGTHTLAFVGGMLVCFLSRRVWRFHASLAPCSGPASRLQTVLKAVTYVVWAVLVLAALVGAGMAAADYVRVHWQELPGLFLHVSHAVWFAWGYLLLAGRVPTVVNGLVSLILAPYYVRRTAFAMKEGARAARAARGARHGFCWNGMRGVFEADGQGIRSGSFILILMMK